MAKYTIDPTWELKYLAVSAEAVEALASAPTHTVTADFSPPVEEIRVVIDSTVGGRPHRTILMGGMEYQRTDHGFTLKCARSSVLDEDVDEIVILNEKQTRKLLKWIKKKGLDGSYRYQHADQDE